MSTPRYWTSQRTILMFAKSCFSVFIRRPSSSAGLGLSATASATSGTLRLREGSVQFLRSPFCNCNNFRSHLRHLVRMAHAYCLPVMLLDFFQAGILRDAKNFPPRGASPLTFGLL